MAEKTEQPTQNEFKEENGAGAAPATKGGLVNTLYPPGPKPGVGPRMKNHCRKFWWCDLLVTAIIVLVITLPVVFVAIPKKAQHDINASTLEVTEQDVTNPQPDSIHLKINSVAKSGSSFHPTIEGFSAGLSLLGKEPFLYVDVPQTKAEASTPITIDQDIKIANMDSFKEYNKVVITNETFDVYLSGKTKVHQPGLRAISVDYTKKVTMKGLNKLSGLNITNLRILSGKDEILSDGSNMVGYVQIPNPSVMTLSLGNVTMNLSVNGTPIGTSLIPNMVLKPGANNISMQSTVQQIDVIQLIQKNYTNAILPLTIVGNSSVIEGGQHLEYFEEAIQSNTIKLDLNVGPALSAIGINTTSLS